MTKWQYVEYLRRRYLSFRKWMTIERIGERLERELPGVTHKRCEYYALMGQIEIYLNDGRIAVLEESKRDPWKIYIRSRPFCRYLGLGEYTDGKHILREEAFEAFKGFYHDRCRKADYA